MSCKIFPAKLESLHEMLDHIQTIGESIGFKAATLDKILLASEEAIVNIINYSYPENTGEIEITCSKTEQPLGINIALKDHGIPFNPLEESGIKNCPKPPIPSIEDSKLGGYGIYIFVDIMDQVDYYRLNGGNLLSLTKYVEDLV